MSFHNALLQQEDFPVGFAEQKEQSDDDTIFYVEWLDNSSEFPGLTTSNDINLTGGNWELLQRKEMNEEEHTLVSVENDAWSKLSTPDSHELYATVAEKNAELQPSKRAIQPVWTNTNHKKIAKNMDAVEDTYEEDLALELEDIHKSQSRRANKMTNRRKLHDIKTVDIYVEGILRLATSHHGKTAITWVPYEKNPSSFDLSRLDTYICSLTNSNNISNKSQAISYASKFTHNTKRYAYKYNQRMESTKRPLFPDSSEFPAQANIVR